MSKKTIMLACAGGMSTSLLVTKMKEAAKKQKLDFTIFATSSNAIDEEIEKEQPDVILLGPQIRYVEKSVKEKTSIPVGVIDMKDYGTMNGENVLQTAISLMKN